MKITPINLRYQKPTDVKDCYIELMEDHLRYKVVFYADEPVIDNDPESGWGNILNNFDILVCKKNIAGIEKSFTKDKKWGVYVIINGFSNDIRTYFNTELAAQIFYDKISQWLLGPPPPPGN